MALSLTTVTTGTAIDATAMRTVIGQIEHFVNEEVSATQLKTSAPWASSIHVVRPTFIGAPTENGTVGTAIFDGAGSEVHYYFEPGQGVRRALFHSDIHIPKTGAASASAYLPVLGMSRTVSLPEVIASGGEPTRRLHIMATWYTYEFGGDGTVDESTDTCADFTLFINGSTTPACARSLFTASSAAGSDGNPGPGVNYAYKQYSLYYPAKLTTDGIHNVGLRLRTRALGQNGVGNDKWRHIFVAERSMVVAWHYR